MLIIDDILAAPFRGLLWIIREIHQAAQEEMDSEAEAITAQLRELYLMVESKSISEEEFALREKRLLDRLDEINARDGHI